jgi:hypothetical protein
LQIAKTFRHRIRHFLRKIINNFWIHRSPFSSLSTHCEVTKIAVPAQIVRHLRPNMERPDHAARTVAVRNSLRSPQRCQPDPGPVPAKRLIQKETAILARNLQTDLLSGCTP